MTQIRKSKLGRKEERVTAALDIGSSKVSCFIARTFIEEGFTPQVDVIGVGHFGMPMRTKGAPASDDIETGIRHAVDAAERMSGEPIRRIHVAIPGRYLRTRRVGVDLEITGGVVTEDDVEDSLAEGAAIAAAEDFQALHALPVGFRIDGEELLADPVGFSAANLSTEMFGVSARLSVIDNLSMLVERCGLKVDVFVAGPVAAAEATLIEDEKELGVVLIDIGSLSTGYAVYDNNVLVDCGGIAVGGGHITKDIAQIFGTPLAQAERIKTLHGAALIGPDDEHRFIDLPQVGMTDETARASRAELCDVIIPRMEEIFELIAGELEDNHRRRGGLRRVVITGGGSLLVGAREIAERVLSMKCRLGRPIALIGAPEAASAPGFAVCAGLIQNTIILDEGPHSSLGVFGQSRQSDKNASFLGDVEAWLRAKF